MAASMRRAILLGVLLAATACPTSPARIAPDAYIVEQADGGLADATATVSCTADPTVCAGDHYCVDGACVADDRCRDDSQCGRDHRCLVPAQEIVATDLTLRVGFCTPNPLSCAQCEAHERCAASGICVPAWSEDGELTPQCGHDRECGAGGKCTDGTCATCRSDADCDRNLACTSGTCSQRSGECMNDDDCYDGNKCDTTTQECKLGCSDSLKAGLMDLEERYLVDVTLCEKGTQHTFVLQPNQGARLVVRTSPATPMTLTATVVLSSSVASGLGIAELSLPGIRIFEIPTSNDTRHYALSLTSADVAGVYAVAFETIDLHCAGDRYDIYGDDDIATAPVVSPTGALTRRLCADDEDFVRVPLAGGDEVKITATDVLVTPPDLELWAQLPDGSGRIEAAPRTATVAQPGMTSQLWAVAVTSPFAPTIGLPYTLNFDLDLGVRNRACMNAPPVMTQHAVSLGNADDLGHAICADWTDTTDTIVEVPIAAGAQVMRARLSPRSGTSGAAHLALLTTCDDDDSARACSRGDTAGVEYVPTSTEAHSVYLMMSADGTTELDLSVDFSPNDDDSCVGARDLALSATSRTATVVVDTRAAIDSVRAVCGRSVGQGADRFVGQFLPAGQIMGLSLASSSTTVLWAASSCDFNAACASSAVGTVDTPAQLVLGPHPRDVDYRIAVDEHDLGPGAVHTLVAFYNPECIDDRSCVNARCRNFVCDNTPPANDWCDGTRIELDGGMATISDTTAGATNAFQLACGGNTAQDVVYSVEVPANSVTLEVDIISASFDPVLEIRQACLRSNNDASLCNDDRSPGIREPALTVALPPSPSASVYYIVVDGFSSADYGTFTMNVSVR